MFYNIYYKESLPKSGNFIFALDEKQLDELIRVYENAYRQFFHNGKTYLFEVIQEIMVFDTSYIVYKDRDQCLESIRDEENVSKITRVPFKLSFYGNEVTNEFIKGPWGYKANFSNINPGISDFVNQQRITELTLLKQNKFDLSKLIQLCKELNIANSSHSYYSVGMIVRAIIDHVPPIFGYSDFNEVESNYKCEGNSKSFKDSMSQLNRSMKKIGDTFMHSHIRKSEILPNETQVDCRRELDVLLGEVVRLLK